MMKGDELWRALAAGLDILGYNRLCRFADPEAGRSPWPNFTLVRNRILLSDMPAADPVLAFRLGIPVPQSRLCSALGETLTEALLAQGMLTEENGMLVPQRLIVPYGGLRILVDPPPFLPSGGVPDPVYLGRDSFLLAEELPLRAERVLDLCSGTGLHGLLMASRGSEVLGADIEPRSTAMARGSAALNGLAGNAVFTTSDLFEAADGVFDLIVTKPPCQAVPDEVQGYPAAGHGGPDGLATARRILEQAGDHLTQQGHLLSLAQMPGGETEIPFLAELERLAARQHFHISVDLRARMTVGRQVANLAVYLPSDSPALRRAWRESHTARGFTHIYDALIDIRRGPTKDLRVTRPAFPVEAAVYQTETDPQLMDAPFLGVTRKSLTPVERDALVLCDGERSLVEIRGVLEETARRQGRDMDEIDAQLDRLFLELIEFGLLSRR